jgi:hypothetical protein
MQGVVICRLRLTAGFSRVIDLPPDLLILGSRYLLRSVFHSEKRVSIGAGFDILIYLVCFGGCMIYLWVNLYINFLDFFSIFTHH